MTATVETSSKRAEANRRNAQRSTGPRSMAGKQRSKFNALKHGLRAKTVILPWEDDAAYQGRLAAWIADLKPRDEAELFLVTRAVEVSWQLDRVARARAARVAAVRHADADRLAAQAEEVAALGRRLFWDPIGPACLYPHAGQAVDESRRVSWSGDPDDPDDPARIVVRLESMALGCAWLLDRWAELREILEDGLLWQPPDRLRAIRMLGRQPLEAVDDGRVLAIYLSCWAMDPDDQHGFTDLIPELTAKERPAYLDRLNGRNPMARMPDSPEEARAELLALIVGEEERLEQALAGHLERERAQADVELAFDDTAWGERLRKYELSSDRTLLRILETLRKRQAESDESDLPRSRASGHAEPSPAESITNEAHPEGPEPLAARTEPRPPEETVERPVEPDPRPAEPIRSPDVEAANEAKVPAAPAWTLAGAIVALFAILFLGGLSAAFAAGEPSERSSRANLLPRRDAIHRHPPCPALESGPVTPAKSPDRTIPEGLSNRRSV